MSKECQYWWHAYLGKPTPTGWVYITLAIINAARAATWMSTSWANSPHVGFLADVPDFVVATAWIVAGIALWFGKASYKSRVLGVTLTAGLNIAVGIASLINYVFFNEPGVTISTAISYIGIAIITLCLPRLTDKETVLNGRKGADRDE